MYFSSILANFSSIKEAKRKGLPVSKYEVTLREIARDYNQMCAFYNSSLARLTAEECQGFAREIDSFFLILNKLNCSQNSLSLEEKSELQNILNQTKIIRDHVSIEASKKYQYRINQADTF